MMATYRSLVLCLVLFVVSMIVPSNGLQCQQCGQFNDGVGSITPCLNYSEKNAHNYLKECPRKTDKFCVVRKFSVPHHQKKKKWNFGRKIKKYFKYFWLNKFCWANLFSRHCCCTHITKYDKDIISLTTLDHWIFSLWFAASSNCGLEIFN